ncbi:MAG: hypothetical protein HOP29_19595 [Phycisphaerales bacterium]|nr:hypothetical protein [Phycisphaerales bacterium]
METWQIDKSAGRCARTGRELAEGEPCYVVLYVQDEGFRREDISADAWTGPPEGAFCHFRTRVPPRDKAKPRMFIDDDLLVNLFLRLKDEAQEMRQQFRFVLSLILMRKRLVKYEDTRHDGDGEYWVLRLTADKSEHVVRNPRLSEHQIGDVHRQLGSVLRGDVAELLGDDGVLPDGRP